MTELLHRLEDRRLELGLTQKDLGRTLGVSQPHYSKMVGGTVPVTPERARKIEEWLRGSPSTPARRSGPNERVRDLVRSIEGNLRELNRLLGDAGSKRRGPRRSVADRQG